MALLSPSTVLVVVLIAIVLWRRWKANAENPGRLPLPPGPAPLPILGNIRDLPLGVPQYELYEAMAQKYGDIIHLNVLGKSIIVLSSLEAISDLLEKRMGMGWSLAIMEYGEQWRRVRKAFHQHYGVHETHKYYDVQDECTLSFLRRILRTPEDLFLHTRHLFGKSIMKVTYGIDVVEENDPFVYHAEQTIAAFNTAARPGRYLVDLIPFLKYIPAWFPGAQFQKDALFAKDMSHKMANDPFNVVKTREANGQTVPCVVSSMLEGIPPTAARAEEEDVILKAAGIAYAGGSDTTVSALQSFFLAMVLYPSVQRRAQAELDAVVGPHRLPTFSDLPYLPYIQAITKECLRWKLVTPLAVPHLTTENDEYRGYFIPKGAIVMGNSYMILHDPAVYPDPHEFKPERFLSPDGTQLNPDVLDPATACFGFGRRMCPGRAFAQDSLFSVVSSVLHTFNIAHALDPMGNQIPVMPDVTDGLISYPKPFACSIKPRSASAEALIRHSDE
ncbi:hypothetical protein EIP91_011634 [Steccherinum ochraceum]|uniref:Cytochrome P450 n=1 Tax=Steccherinum ochraceum TaxID=92696 RepID=A0A4R0RLZ2_9APHY|nr:hypothetical protein EIP91_011634 [Steccherinum ochraceum]